MNSSRYFLVTIITINIYFLYIFKISLFDHILNILISYGVYNYYKERNFFVDDNISKFQLILSFCLLIAILYRCYWLHIDDNFIYLLFLSFLSVYALISNKISNLILNLKPFLIAILFPITKILFIPISIIITPFSTLFTWLALNIFGFSSVMKGQEIFYNNPGIDVTFSCSGSGQILFCLSAMIILNIFFPFKNRKFLIIQLYRSFIFTFSANVARLFLLAIYSYTFDYSGFSIFRYLHGGNGGLLFSFFSMLLSCESYKRLYFRSLEIK